MTDALLDRVRAAVVETLVLTADTPASPKKEWNIRNGFGIPIVPSLRAGIDVAIHRAGWREYFCATHSSHGGRNLDSALAPIDVLPAIAERVGTQMTILADSGIRRGSDIAKYLACSAQAVMLGRALLYGTAARGEEGAADFLADPARRAGTHARVPG